MTARIRLPAALRETAGGIEFETNAVTVRSALDELIARVPVLRRHLFDDNGALRGYVNVFLNADDVRALGGLEVRLGAGDEVLIVPSVSGGTGNDGLGADELLRYSRHLSLPGFGLEGQRRLKAARVLVVGTGGLGSPASLYLAAAGVGTIGLVDFDAIDVTNLQRQVLFDSEDIGASKVFTAQRKLSVLNPHIDVVAHDIHLTRDNALEVIAQYDIVIDGTDNFPTRYLVNDSCVLLGKPYVYGSILRFDGQVSVFDARTGPCYRCLFREPPPPGLVPSCAEGGVLGVLPGIIGAAQALEAIKLAIGAADTLAGRLLLFDALRFKWRELTLRKNPDCPICGDTPTITGLIDYDEFCGIEPEGEESMEVREMTPAELKQRLDRGDDLRIIDVREPFEWDIVNLKEHGAKLIPLGELAERYQEIPPDAEIVMHCRSGGRSAKAAEFLQQHGYANVWNMAGGIGRWTEDVDPSKPRY